VVVGVIANFLFDVCMYVCAQFTDMAKSVLFTAAVLLLLEAVVSSVIRPPEAKSRQLEKVL